MNEPMLLGGVECVVPAGNQIAPTLTFFYDLIRSGWENSVVLGMQTKHRAMPQSEDDAVSVACREAVAHARQMTAGPVGDVSPSLLALAKRAAEQCAARKDEDIQSWADQIAREVSDSTD